MNRLFESKEVAKAYVKYRPRTPEFVKDAALEFLRGKSSPNSEGKFGLLLDVGCGSGQSSEIFAPYFNRVIGVDPSEEQIKQAKSNNEIENIEYVVGDGGNLPVSDGTVDMVVVGQALHWFDLDKFFAECKRVMTPGGCFFAFGYTTPSIAYVERLNEPDFAERKSESDALTVDFRDNQCHYDPRVMYLETYYKREFAAIPTDDKMRRDDTQMTREMSFQAVASSVNSLSGYQNHVTDTVKELRKKNPNMTHDEAMDVYMDKYDIKKKYTDALKKCWSIDPTKPECDVPMQLVWDVPMLMSGRPKC